MSFLTPLFLLGLVGLAVPVIIHLIQRERKNVVQFPSLMFLQRIPYQSVHAAGFGMAASAASAGALALIARRLARRFSAAGARAARGRRARSRGVDRTSPTAWDRDRWRERRRRHGRHRPVGSRGPRVGRVLCSGAEVAMRVDAGPAAWNAAVSTGKPGAGATRTCPALKLAGSIASESALPRREVFLFSISSAPDGRARGAYAA